MRCQFENGGACLYSAASLRCCHCWAAGVAIEDSMNRVLIPLGMGTEKGLPIFCGKVLANSTEFPCAGTASYDAQKRVQVSQVRWIDKDEPPADKAKRGPSWT